MVLAAVFLISLCSLVYEVLLARFFSISQWNHLSFMVISIVLFGFAAGGTFLSLLEKRRPGWSERLYRPASRRILPLLYSLSAAVSFLAVNRIPLDYFRMPLDWLQALYLLLTYLLLILPFFFVGLIIALAFAALPEKSGWIYFASMSGSALGALLPAVLLPLLGEGRIILLSALLPLGLVMTAGRSAEREGRRMRPLKPLTLALALTLCLLFVLFQRPSWLEIRPSPYKLLAQSLKFPDTRITRSLNTLRGRLDLLESPYLRFAPGLSLQYQEQLPPRNYLVRDADLLYVFFERPDPEAADFAAYSHAYAAYSVHPGPEEVLLLQQGGGLGQACARAARAGEITLLVDLPPRAWERIEGQLLPPKDGAGSSGGLSARAREARGYLARSDKRFDLIQVENWGASIPGVASLSQEHLLTVEALEECLGHLKEGGILTLSRKLYLPPSDSLRLTAAVYEALESLGVKEPDRHIMVLRSWGSYTLLASPNPFSPGAIERLKSFCRELNFDLVHYPGILPGEANIFNVFDRPFHFERLQALLRALREGHRVEFFADYYLDVRPAIDDRPFHNRFTRWLRIGSLYRSTGSRFYSLLISGETVVLAVLAEALLLGFVLLILPLLALRGPSARLQMWKPAYFFLVGAGFILVELAFIQEYTLLFGDPVMAFTIVLSGMLIFSALGGAISARWGPVPLRLALLAIVLILTACFSLLGPLVRALLGLPPLLRAVGGILLLLPPSFLVGIPFPAGLRLLLDEPGERAYGWAANGVASVVFSILAMPLAMSWGISRVLMGAGLAYLLVLALLLLLGKRKVEGSVAAGPA